MRYERMLRMVGWTALLMTCAHAVVAATGIAWQEGWWYYDLAQSFGTSFYRFHTWRGFVNHSPYSSASPPIFPALVAVVRGTTGLGPLSGVVINYCGLLVLALVHDRFLRGLLGVGGLGAILTLSLLASWSFDLELNGASNHVWPLVILSAQLCLLSKKDRHRYAFEYVAFLGGVAVMCRFDLMVTEAVIMAGLVYWSRSARRIGLLAGIFLTPLIPWIVYSVIRFGVPFASDNTWVATLAEQGFVSDYRRRAFATLFNAPWRWLLFQQNHARGMLKACLLSLMDSALPWACLAYGAAIVFSRRGSERWRFALDRLHAWLPSLTLLLVACCAGLVPHTLMGFTSGRYFLPLIWALSLAGLIWSFGELSRRGYQTHRYGFSALALSFLCSNITMARHGAYGSQQQLSAYLAGEEYGPVVRCLSEAGVNEDETVLIAHMSGALSSRLGAITRRKVAGLPNNWFSLSQSEVEQFLNEYDIHYIYLPEEVSKNARDDVGLPPVDVSDRIDLEKVPGCDAPLYRGAPKAAERHI